ncbi:HNH endonuclease [Ectopseudomonas oleovorans]|uniref:HNH endonuclease n=2 Tax=Gammaproteobacteria TaxID=1236 RepID=UPI00241D6F18|nr:HNH endonuclease signature motif containing protein [Pseudomonas oleovorans]
MSNEQDDRVVEELQRFFRFGEWNAKRGLQTGGRCEYCDRDLLASFNDYDSWQIDHVMPSSKGGKHEYENMAVCCKTCNFLKRDYLPSGETRDERVADARRHVQALRVVREAELARVRALVQGQLEMRPTSPDFS